MSYDDTIYYIEYSYLVLDTIYFARSKHFFAVEQVMKNNFKWKLTSKYSHIGAILGTTAELNQVERWILKDCTNKITTAACQRHWLGSRAPLQGFLHQLFFGGKGEQARADKIWPATDQELYSSQLHIAAVQQRT